MVTDMYRGGCVAQMEKHETHNSGGKSTRKAFIYMREGYDMVKFRMLLEKFFMTLRDVCTGLIVPPNGRF
jgi:hypothetical protein